MKVFLGGTCNNSTWRETLIPMLKISYFNPVVKHWTEEAQIEELQQREESDFCLYVITPKMTGVYSIAEVVEDSIKRPQKTILCILAVDDEEIFTLSQMNSLLQVEKMVERNGVKVCYGLPGMANYLNGKAKHE